jgi:hypothetical protein
MNLLKATIVSRIILVVCSITVAPTWVTSPYVQADSHKIIDGDLCSCTTGNSSTPTAIMTFINAFSSQPHLGYGISKYEGKNDIEFR